MFHHTEVQLRYGWEYRHDMEARAAVERATSRPGGGFRRAVARGLSRLVGWIEPCPPGVPAAEC